MACSSFKLNYWSFFFKSSYSSQVVWIIDLNAYDVTEGRPCALGVKRGTATCAIAKHAASGPTPACHTAGLAQARALTERLSANALCQHNTCAQRNKSWPPTWRRCYGDVTSMHKVYKNCTTGVTKIEYFLKEGCSKKWLLKNILITQTCYNFSIWAKHKHTN